MGRKSHEWKSRKSRKQRKQDVDKVPCDVFSDCTSVCIAGMSVANTYVQH